MGDAQDQMERIQQKMQLLVRQWTSLRKEYDKLLRENALLKQQETTYKETMGQLNQQVQILKVTSGSWEEGDKKAMEKKINSYIREIDRCIVLLTG
jgi:regulator of replication initiation timing